MKMKMDNRGLLSLGLIFSLGLTLTGFEYISSDTKYTKKRMAKAEFIEDETIFIPEIQKPEIPIQKIVNPYISGLSEDWATNSQQQLIKQGKTLHKEKKNLC